MTIPHPSRRRPARRRRAFTLTEMLVVIMIIALLSSMVLVAMASVQEQTREKRTRAQIARLHELLMAQYESYQTRRVPTQRQLGESRFNSAVQRVNAIRELMRMELPDRMTDISDEPALFPRPAISWAYLRRIPKADESDPTNVDNWYWTSPYQEAECLYMIVSRIRVGDENGLEFFSENEIGDIDNDGMPEIHDAWGNPIQFLRWAPGFQSPLQPVAMRLGGPQEPTPVNHDPLDPMEVYGDTFALYPLIFSAGPDGKYQINLDDYVVQNGNVVRVHIHYSQTASKDFPPPTPPLAELRAPNNPFVELPQSRMFIGTPAPDDNGYLDNIHNHQLMAN
jgi:prepilin-type N-terminal cleavage/methylation domain-containing protein